ncbi:hypothetical protein DBR43_25870 [Pedobacter sp. KBW06]|uniref:FecR family protein n=1 Tax=Pedobacter sp. KBW06 TaxID=2153359 RepID=UPI000F5B4022|nr:FecR domain-containing protein [Pedobacter sp. KBW06]RQO67938.1 hypothetical protein DBR43_25870 [Pedobacter sp. KBW06]
MEHQDDYFLITNALSNPENLSLQEELKTWRALDQRNEEEYQAIRKIWEQSAHIEETYSGRDIEEAVSAFTTRLEAKIYEEKPKVKVVGLWWKSAAAVLAFAILGLWTYKSLQTEVYTFKSTLGQRDSLMLADGSKVYLNKNTQIKYSSQFSKEKREFFLMKGEAFFNITKDAAHPFRVFVNKSKIQVLGTTFNIQNIDSTIAVEVKTGKVSFESRENATSHILEKDMGIRYDQKTGIVKKYIDLDRQTNSNWLYRELNFVDATLPEVCALIEKQYDVKITIKGKISNIRKLNANFRNDPLKDVLDALKITYKISIEHHDNQIVIKQ